MEIETLPSVDCQLKIIVNNFVLNRVDTSVFDFNNSNDSQLTSPSFQNYIIYHENKLNSLGHKLYENNSLYQRRYAIFNKLSLLEQMGKFVLVQHF